MMEIAVKVAGDHWLNPEEVEQRLQAAQSDRHVVLDMGSEGPSLHALGVARMIDRYLSPDRVTIRAWANAVEAVPYHRADAHFYSHFFWMAQRYWHAAMTEPTHERRFGCFIGRATWPRLRMLADLRRNIPDKCLLSLMDLSCAPTKRGHNLDSREQWIDPDLLVAQYLGDLGSIDGMQVRDQYDPRHNTNLSIIEHYARFDIEIVSETYCHGDTFLPTEKTVRPLLYRRPIMVYGPRYFLRRLRDQGFQTWSDWWDESYDLLTGPDRWQAMWQQIQILARCDHFDLIWDDCQQVLDHNRARAQEIGSRHRPR